jgi:hypothetical protein
MKTIQFLNRSSGWSPVLKSALFILFLLGPLAAHSQGCWTKLTYPNVPLSSPCINNSVKFHHGITFIATNFGLEMYDGTNWTLQSFGTPPNEVTDVCIDKDTTIWVVTVGTVYNKRMGLPWQLFPLPGYITSRVCSDDLNNKWFICALPTASSAKFIMRYDNVNLQVYDTANSGLPGSNITDLIIHVNDVWVKTGPDPANYVDNVIARFDGTSWISYNNLSWGIPGSFPSSFDVDLVGNLWVSINDLNANYRLLRYNGSSWATFIPSTPTGTSILTKVDLQGNVWIIQYGVPMYKFDGLNFSSCPFPPYDYNPIISISNDQTGRLWVCGYCLSPQIALYDDWGINAIKGKVFRDLNADGIKQSNEPCLPNLMVHMMPDNFYKISDTAGYEFRTCDTTGTSNVSISFPSNWYLTSSPSTYNITQTYANQVTDSINFGLAPLTNTSDVSIDLTLVTARPGFDNLATITITNNGPNLMSDTLTLILDPQFALTITPIPPLINTGNNIVKWVYTNLAAFETRKINFWAMLSSSAVPGTIVTDVVSINPTLYDLTPLDNTDTASRVITSSFDPNVKEVNPVGESPGGYILPSQKLTYTLLFQNSGNDTCFNVIIKDTLPQAADLLTLKIISSSHPVTYQLYGKLLVFTMINVVMPCATVNEPFSHGFVKYSFLPLVGISPGTLIDNKAYIIFDFNTPVITNTVTNTIDLAFSVGGCDRPDHFLLWPNPANNQLNIRITGSPAISHLLVYDILGRLIIRETPDITNEMKVDISTLKQGVYIVQLITETEVLERTFIKEY